METVRGFIYRSAVQGLLAWGLLLIGCEQAPVEPVAVPVSSGLSGFEARIDSIRVALRIPGMAAAIASGNQIVWSRGFGLADVDRNIPATDSTSFYVASVTKPVAAIILMQLVEEGTLDLEDPVVKHGLDIPSEGVVTIRNLFNHTSEGVPGTAFRYNHERFSHLGAIMRSVAGKTFAQLLAQRIVTPLGLRNTGPDPNLLADFYSVNLDRRAFVANVAMPYELMGDLVVPSSYMRHFSPGAGLVSSVRDLAAISIALDQDRYFSPSTGRQMLSSTIEIDGPNRTYGLGWFIQWEKGVKLEWHHGWANAHSALLLRAPDKRLTFVVVANTSRLSGAYNMSVGDVMQSGPGRLFVESFVLGNQPIPQ